MRNENITILNDTLRILNQGYYTINGQRINLKLSREEMQKVSVFLPEDIKRIAAKRTATQQPSANRMDVACENMDSYTLARKRNAEYPDLSDEQAKPILVLNFANPVNPGGGVRRGAKAQEEDLCRKSTLLPSLESPEANAYYTYNRTLNTYMGSHAVMITPKVEIIKDEKGNLLKDSLIVSVMTCAAPMLRNGMEGMTDQEYQDMFYERILGMLHIAGHLGYTTLILGAFGCGAFMNDAHIVSDLFYKALKNFTHSGLKAEKIFQRIDFGVLSRSADQYNYKEFARNFDDYYREEKRTNPDYTFFWLDHEKNGEFSNWYQRDFVIDDFRYFCVEQYMMSQKAKLFHDSERYTAILRANTPAGCKALGKKVTPFDYAKWNEIKYDVVKTGNRAKFAQNSDLRKMLLQTGNTLLAEASPKDTVWGIGLDARHAGMIDPNNWPGQNLLGKILMELRDEFS